MSECIAESYWGWVVALFIGAVVGLGIKLFVDALLAKEQP
jgi:hypothetical protein